MSNLIIDNEHKVLNYTKKVFKNIESKLIRLKLQKFETKDAGDIIILKSNKKEDLKIAVPKNLLIDKLIEETMLEIKKIELEEKYTGKRFKNAYTKETGKIIGISEATKRTIIFGVILDSGEEKTINKEFLIIEGEL